MIRVARGPALEGFEQRAHKWEDDYRAAKDLNQELTVSVFWGRIRSHIQDDAAQLFQIFHGKCAFCESHMAHVSSPNVEHYRPKSRFPELAFRWDNWLLSCGRCNDKKWAHFPDCNSEPCLIDPTEDDPEAHIEFVGYVPMPRTKRGDETIRLIQLDRSPLEEERSWWLACVNGLLVLCVSSDIQEIRQEARLLLVWSMQDEAPYAAMTRCYLREKAPRLASPLHPHPHVVVHEPIQRIQQLVDDLAIDLERLE